MSRLSTLFVLGSAGLLLTPMGASAQFGRFGFPMVHLVPPVAMVPVVSPVAIVPPVSIVRPVFPVATVPFVRPVSIVQPVPIVRPVVGFPQFRSFSSTQISFNTTMGGSFGFRSSQFFVGPSLAARSLSQPFTQNAPTYVSGAYTLPAESELERAQREASRVASSSTNSAPRAASVVAVSGPGEVLPDTVRRVPADAVQITSGEALNNVMKEITRAESKNAKYPPSGYIPPMLIKDVRFSGSPAADLLNFVREGALEFPAALDVPALASARSELAKEFAASAELVRAGKGPDAAGAIRIVAAAQRLEEAAAPVLKDLPPGAAADARQFLNRLNSSIKVLKSGYAYGLIDPNWALEGLTGAELVKHMTKYKLQFGPAPRGASESYETVLGNLSTYLFMLNQPKR